MERFKEYRAESVSAEQLQRLFLLTMGVRFEEISSVVGGRANNEFIYLPGSSWYKQRGWRIEFWDWVHCARVSWLPEEHVGPFEIPRKIKYVTGVPAGSLISVKKISGSGNQLFVYSRNIQRNNPSFNLCVEQKISQPDSHWFDMLGDIGVKLRSKFELEWSSPNML